jgi:hypothetical protein
MTRKTDSLIRFDGFARRDHGAFAAWERREARDRLRVLTIEESCAEFAALLGTFGARPPADLLPLLERDERERRDIVVRRQTAFRRLAEAKSGTIAPGAT